MGSHVAGTGAVISIRTCCEGSWDCLVNVSVANNRASARRRPPYVGGGCALQEGTHLDRTKSGVASSDIERDVEHVS